MTDQNTLLGRNNLDPAERAEAVLLIRTALGCLDHEPHKLHRVTGRLADALMLLGQLDDSLPGIGTPTERGAQLRRPE